MNDVRTGFRHTCRREIAWLPVPLNLSGLRLPHPGNGERSCAVFTDKVCGSDDGRFRICFPVTAPPACLGKGSGLTPSGTQLAGSPPWSESQGTTLPVRVSQPPHLWRTYFKNAAWQCAGDVAMPTCRLLLITL